MTFSSSGHGVSLVVVRDNYPASESFEADNLADDRDLDRFILTGD